MRVNFFGFLKAKFSVGSEEVSVASGARLCDLFLQLAERYGEHFKSYIFDTVETEVKSDILVNINDVPIRLKRGLKTELKEGDQVDFFPLFAGGG